MQKVHRVCGFLMLLCLGAITRAEEKTFQLGDDETLHISLPADWSAQFEEAPAPTLTVDAPAGKHVKLLMTLLPAQKSKPTDASVKTAATNVGTKMAEGSKEKKVTLEPLKGAAIHGYLSSFTDASADPGEYPYATAGVAALGTHTVAITLLSADLKGPDRAAALDALKSVTLTDGHPVNQPASKPAAAADAGKALRVSSPDGAWTVVVPGHWQEVAPDKSPDGNAIQCMTIDTDSGWILSIFIEPAPRPGDAKAAREFYFNNMKRNPIPMTGVKRSENGAAAVLEYNQGAGGVDAKNVNTYLASGNLWVDVHISKPGYDEKADRKALDAMVKGIKIDKQPAAKK